MRYERNGVCDEEERVVMRGDDCDVNEWMDGWRSGSTCLYVGVYEREEHIQSNHMCVKNLNIKKLVP